MISFNNNDLFQILLNRLRKDRKGSINAEEFESFLRSRNLDYFNQQFNVDGVSQINTDSLQVFAMDNEPIAVTQDGSLRIYLATLPTGATAYAHAISAFYSTSSSDLSTLVEMDLVSNAELPNRLNNAITGPSAVYPIGWITDLVMRVYGVTTGYVILNYYRYPLDPYFDYYTDAYGNITYLTDGQPAHTLLAGQVSRSGLTAGQPVTSASVDLEWGDQDAVNILDMVMSDVSLSQNDQAGMQSSILERQNNVTS